MPAPSEITYASRDYEAFAADLKQAAMLQTHNQVYAMTRAVLHAFRDRLTVADAIAFAQGLPAVLRAIAVEGWSGEGAPVPFDGAEAFRADVVARLSPHHVPPDSIVADVAAAIRRHADPHAFAQALAALPTDLADLWRP